MARCAHHDCGHYDPEVAGFLKNECPKCGHVQPVCVTCGCNSYEEACTLRKNILKELNLYCGRYR